MAICVELRSLALFCLITAVFGESKTIFYRFHDKNNATINNCILTAMDKLRRETCLTFSKVPKPGVDRVISFVESNHCAWQDNNATIHMAPHCVNDDTCINIISKALTNERPHYGVVRHLNLKFNCTDKCTTFCHNGGVLQEDCTCKCGYGLSGKFCEQLSLKTFYTDSSCGVVRADNEGTLALSTYPSEANGRTFCQWLVKPANPWETIEFEFLEMDLNSQDLLTNSDCADSFVVLGSKDIKTQIPCNDKFSQFKGKLYRSDSDWVMFVLNGNSHTKGFKGPLIRYRIINSSNKEIRSFSLDSFINSASTFSFGLLPLFAVIFAF